MTSILIPYGTGEGQTAKVAAYVEAVLVERGFDVTAVDLVEAVDADESGVTTGDGSGATTGDGSGVTTGDQSDATTGDQASATTGDGPDAAGRGEFDGPAVEDFDAVLVGASVHSGEHQPEVVAFVERNAETLAGRPSGFFEVSPASVLPGRWARDGEMDYVDRLGAATGWQPDRVGLFAAAPRYSQYERPTRWLFGLAALVTGRGTDASGDHEYTDWDDVERFAVEFGEFVESEREPAGPLGAVRAAGVGRRGLRAAAVAVLGLGVAAVVYRTVGRRERAPGGRDRVSPEPSVDDADREPSGQEAEGPEAAATAGGE